MEFWATEYLKTAAARFKTVNPAAAMPMKLPGPTGPVHELGRPNIAIHPNEVGTAAFARQPVAATTAPTLSPEPTIAPPSAAPASRMEFGGSPTMKHEIGRRQRYGLGV